MSKIKVVGFGEMFMDNGERALVGERVATWTHEDQQFDDPRVQTQSQELFFIEGSIFYKDDNTEEVLWVSTDDFEEVE